MCRPRMKYPRRYSYIRSVGTSLGTYRDVSGPGLSPFPTGPDGDPRTEGTTTNATLPPPPQMEGVYHR